MGGTTVAASQASPIQSRLLGYWKLDETSSTSASDSWMGNTATLSGAAAFNAGGVATMGNGYGVAFSTDGSIITVPYAPIVLTGDSASISLWVKFSSLPVTEGHSSYLLRMPNVFELFVDSAANMVSCRFYNNDSSIYFNHNTVALTLSTWYHIVVINGGVNGFLKLYINGSDVGHDTTVFTGNFYTLASNAFIGNYSAAQPNQPVGIIDEVGIWNRALTTTEITTLYNAGSGKTYPFV